MSYFSELGLAEPVLRALGAKGYADPTPIQRQAIPALLEGRDLLGIAQTGTGKTAAFSLPSIHRLAADPQPRKSAACRMLVLSPTRELAAQIAENIRGYGKFLNLSIQCVFGGMPIGKQARALVPGCDILVATPGRLLDLIEQRALTLRHVEIFVLDEADQMMDLGFIAPLKRIAKLLPEKRQSLFFSATMPKAIAELGAQFINDPVRVEVTPQATTAERVEQYATFLNQSEKQALLTLKLREGLGDGSIDRALVFSRTKHGADKVVRHLVTAGIQAAAIHGNKSQGQRTGAIKDFRSGAVPVLIATDIAARGIDIPGVSHVFNYELPNVAEQYVHRIGRTARNGAEGIALSFVAPDERAYLRDIERLTRVKLEPMPLPADFTKEAARLPLPSRAAVTAATGVDEHAEARAPRGRAMAGGRRNGRLPASEDNTPRPRATHSAEPTDRARRPGARPVMAGGNPHRARPDADFGHDGARPARGHGERHGAAAGQPSRRPAPAHEGPAAERPHRNHETRGERGPGEARGYRRDGDARGQRRDGAPRAGFGPAEGRAERGYGEGRAERGYGEGRAERGYGEGRAERGSGGDRTRQGGGEGRPQRGFGEGRAERGQDMARPERRVGEGRPERSHGEGRPQRGFGGARPERRAGDERAPAARGGEGYREPRHGGDERVARPQRQRATAEHRGPQGHGGGKSFGGGQNVRDGQGNRARAGHEAASSQPRARRGGGQGEARPAHGGGPRSRSANGKRPGGAWN